MLAHHGCWSITQSYGVTVSNETMCDACGWPQLVVRRAVQTDPTLLRYAPAITEQKKCLVLLAEKIDRFQPLHTSPNNMQQGAQTDAIYNIQQCWELLTNKVAPVFTRLKPLFQRGSWCSPFPVKMRFRIRISVWMVVQHASFWKRG